MNFSAVFGQDLPADLLDERAKIRSGFLQESVGASESAVDRSADAWTKRYFELNEKYLMLLKGPFSEFQGFLALTEVLSCSVEEGGDTVTLGLKVGRVLLLKARNAGSRLASEEAAMWAAAFGKLLASGPSSGDAALAAVAAAPGPAAVAAAPAAETAAAAPPPASPVKPKGKGGTGGMGGLFGGGKPRLERSYTFDGLDEAGALAKRAARAKAVKDQAAAAAEQDPALRKLLQEKAAVLADEALLKEAGVADRLHPKYSQWSMRW
jgi:hypothetical protein